MTDLTFSILIQQINEIKDTTSQSLGIKLKKSLLKSTPEDDPAEPMYRIELQVKSLTSWFLHVLLLKSRIVV